MRHKLIFAFYCIMFLGTANAQLVVHPEIPSTSIPKYAKYTVEVRIKGDTSWKAVSVYTSLSVRNTALESGFATFDFNGAVEVRVTKTGSSATNAKIRPETYNIPITSRSGAAITFELSSPKYLSIEFGDEGSFYKEGNLVLLTDPLEVNAPKQGDANVIYLGPGVHKKGTDARIVTKFCPQYGIDRDEIILENNETLYLAGGAVFEGQVTIVGKTNVKVIGRGFIDHRKYFADNKSMKDTFASAIRLWGSKNVEIDGITASEAFWRPITISGSDGVIVKNFKGFSFREYSDGFSVNSSRNITADRVFMRTADDPLSIYNSRNIGYDQYYGNTQDCSFSNLVLWADHGPGIVIGWHGNRLKNGMKNDTMQRHLYKNIVVLESLGDWEIFDGGALSFNCGGENVIKDMRFEDLTLEHTVASNRLFNIRVYNDAFYEGGFPVGALGKSISKVYVKNLTYKGQDLGEKSEISGWAADRTVDDVTFENLNYMGEVINGTNFTKVINIGNYASNVSFYNPGEIQTTKITITSNGNINSIAENGKTLQLYAISEPDSVTSKSVIWSIKEHNACAEMDSKGLLTPFKNGVVTVVASALDGSHLQAEFVVVISNQIENLLADPTFELNNRSWIKSTNEEGYENRTGKGYGKSNYFAFTSGATGIMYQPLTISLVAGKSYTLTYYGKISWTDNVPGTQFAIESYFYTYSTNPNNRTLVSTQSDLTSADYFNYNGDKQDVPWRQYTHNFTVSPSQAGKKLLVGFDVKVNSVANNNTWAWFDNFMLTESNPSAIKNNHTNGNLKLYPNPVEHNAPFSITFNEVLSGKLEICNAFGIILYKTPYFNQNKLVIQTNSLCKGLLFVKITSKGSSHASTLLVN